MKNVVGQKNFRGGIGAGAFQFAAGECAFAANIHFAGWSHGSAKCFADVAEIEPAAITVFPMRRVEVGHFGLEVEMRGGNRKLALFDGEAVVPQREFCGCGDGNGKKSLVGESDILPFEISGVERMSQAAASIQCEMQIAAFQGERRFDVVVENPSVGEFDVPDAQPEKIFALRLCGSAGHGGNVGGAVFFDADVDMGFADDQLRERDFSAPEGIDVQAGTHFFGSEERLRAGGLFSVNDQAVYGGAEREPLDRDAANVRLPASDFVDAADGEAPN